MSDEPEDAGQSKRRHPRPPGLLPAKRLQELKGLVFPEVKAPKRQSLAPYDPLLPVDPLLPTRKEVYCEMVEAGLSHARASRAAGLTPRRAAELMAADRDWQERAKAAFETGTDYLEDLAFFMAHDNASVLMRLLEARRSNRYSRKAIQGGPSVTVNVAPLYGTPETVKVLPSADSVGES